MDVFPNEIVEQISGHLGVEDVVSLSETCRRFERLFDDHYWKMRVEATYPDESDYKVFEWLPWAGFAHVLERVRPSDVRKALVFRLGSFSFINQENERYVPDADVCLWLSMKIGAFDENRREDVLKSVASFVKEVFFNMRWFKGPPSDLEGLWKHTATRRPSTLFNSDACNAVFPVLVSQSGLEKLTDENKKLTDKACRRCPTLATHFARIATSIQWYNRWHRKGLATVSAEETARDIKTVFEALTEEMDRLSDSPRFPDFLMALESTVETVRDPSLKTVLRRAVEMS